MALQGLLSRPSSESFASFSGEESQTSPKLTRFPGIQSPEVLEKRLADFVGKLKSYQQGWEGAGKRQCPGPQDHPGLGDSMSQRPTPPRLRHAPSNQHLSLTKNASTESSETWRSLPVVEHLAPPKKYLPIYLDGHYARACADFGAAANVMDAKFASKLRLKVVLDSSCVPFELPTFGKTIKPIGRATVDCQFPREPQGRHHSWRRPACYCQCIHTPFDRFQSAGNKKQLVSRTRNHHNLERSWNVTSQASWEGRIESCRRG